MLNPDVIGRLREKLRSTGFSTPFENWNVMSSHLMAIAVGEVETVAREAAWSGIIEGPTRIFGTPSIPTCLNDVGTSLRSVPEKELYRVPGGRIIGNNAVVTPSGGILAPNPVRTDEDFRALTAVNERDHQGFAVAPDLTGLTAYFCSRRQPRLRKLDVLFFHNLESGNYGSFIFRQLPQMLFASKVSGRYDAYVVGTRTPWLYEALDMCGFAHLPIYEVREVCGDQFQSVTLCNEFDSEGVLAPVTMDSIRHLGGTRRDIGSTPNHIFVSRNLNGVYKPKYRNLSNELELETLGESFGYKIVAPETLTLSGQIELFRNAATVAGPSGSGMLNSIFCDSTSRVLDIESFHFTVRQHSKVYGSAGVEYSFLFGAFDPLDAQPPFLKQWSVQLEEARLAFEWLRG